MDKDDDRRASHRIDHPDAVVKYKKKAGLLFSFSDAIPILNLSKSGLALQISDALNYGENLNMILEFADGKSFKLKGLVRWQREDNQSTKFFTTGIQFNPFGKQYGYNSILALDYLRSLDGLSISKTTDPQIGSN
jgi:hypothetical protein